MRRRPWWSALVVVALVALAAPAAFGAALMPVLKAIGTEQAHSCQCGMRQGDCGCPECARLERVRRLGEAPLRAPSLKSHCGDDATGLALVPAGIPSPAFATIPPAPRGRAVALAPVPRVLSANRAPPTPPPRTIAA